MIISIGNANYSAEGIRLAIISSGITSEIGYTICHIALCELSVTQAAVVQLLVPVIATFGGVLFITEKISFRLTIPSILILEGKLIVVLTRKKDNNLLLRNNSRT